MAPMKSMKAMKTMKAAPRKKAMKAMKGAPMKTAMKAKKGSKAMKAMKAMKAAPMTVVNEGDYEVALIVCHRCRVAREICGLACSHFKTTTAVFVQAPSRSRARLLSPHSDKACKAQSYKAKFSLTKISLR